MSRSQLLIPGGHNVENALAAAVLARHGGADLEGLRLGLKSYPGLAHRLVLCGERDGIKAYNDSKGTNIDATLTGIRALPGPLVLLLGGQDKGSGYLALRPALEGKLRRLVLPGRGHPAAGAGPGRPAARHRPALRRGGNAGPGPGPAGRPGAAQPRLRQLRSVRELRAARRAVRGAGAGLGQGVSAVLAARCRALALDGLRRPGGPAALPGRFLVVDVAGQRLGLLENGALTGDYPVSTAAAGIGGAESSLRTPPGWHRIRARIGAGAPGRDGVPGTAGHRGGVARRGAGR